MHLKAAVIIIYLVEQEVAVRNSIPVFIDLHIDGQAFIFGDFCLLEYDAVPFLIAVFIPAGQNNSNISAPVNIHVHASGMSAEAIGQGIYDTAERYLMRTLEHVGI